MVLAKPVYHIGFLDLCKKILSCVCFHCSKILCYKPKEIERIKKIKDGKLRIREMYKLCGSGAGGRTCMTHDDKDDDLEKK
jgi:DNA-directed RNA polymerase II subunit RPB1